MYFDWCHLFAKNPKNDPVSWRDPYELESFKSDNYLVKEYWIRKLSVRVFFINLWKEKDSKMNEQISVEARF